MIPLQAYMIANQNNMQASNVVGSALQNEKKLRAPGKLKLRKVIEQHITRQQQLRRNDIMKDSICT
jgi:hypothetical protein